MKKKKMLFKLLAVLLGICIFLSACGTASQESTQPADEPAKTDDSSNGSETTNETDESDKASEVVVPKFEDIEFPDEMPLNPTPPEDDHYAYDDMTKSYKLEFFTYNYGVPNPPAKDDPILKYLEEKYNVSLTLTTVSNSDVETYLSTRFASGDEPDLMSLPSRDMGFTLGEQGLLVDAREQYPYMPQTCKFVTKNIIAWSTMEDGTIPFTTKYAVQDSDIWGFAIRQDWLDKFGMKPPTSKEELLAYAKACTKDDPDGNGNDDTWFMSGAGGGQSFGMLGNFMSMFGNPSPHLNEDGVLEHPLFNGTQKEFLQFINELYSNGYLTPDWYTIDWEQNKSYTMNDRVGMVWYPAKNLYEEYFLHAKGGDPAYLDIWTYWSEPPIEGGKYSAAGNPGVLWALSARRIGDDIGKMKRILHMLDAMCYMGEDYFATVQGGGLEVHEGYDADIRKYTEDGKSICYVDPSHPGYTVYGSNNLELAPWQNFGYTLKWQIEVAPSPELEPYANKINEMASIVSAYDRWPNDSLRINIPGDLAPNLEEFERAQFFKFATGERSFDEWDTFLQEWLDKGGRKVLEATAKSLGGTLPDNMK